MAQTRSAAKADKHDRYQSKYRSSLPDSLVQRSQRNHRSTTPRDNKTKSKGNFIQVFILIKLIFINPFKEVFWLYCFLMCQLC